MTVIMDPCDNQPHSPLYYSGYRRRKQKIENHLKRKPKRFPYFSTIFHFHQFSFSGSSPQGTPTNSKCCEIHIFAYLRHMSIPLPTLSFSFQGTTQTRIIHIKIYFRRSTRQNQNSRFHLFSQLPIKPSNLSMYKMFKSF